MNWLYEFDVNKFVREAPEDIVDPKPVADKIIAALQGHQPFSTSEGDGILSDLASAKDRANFNEALDRLYDFANEQRVWLGL
jgi:hypothetical protein